MPTTPAGAKKPQDKKPSKAALEREQIADEDRLLAGMPELYGPHELRIRERNRVVSIALRLRALASEDGELDIDTETDSPELRELLDVIADADDFAESIAVDKGAYITWARGTAQYEHFTAILTRYGRAVGESSGSSN